VTASACSKVILQDGQDSRREKEKTD